MTAASIVVVTPVYEVRVASSQLFHEQCSPGKQWDNPHPGPRHASAFSVQNEIAAGLMA